MTTVVEPPNNSAAAITTAGARPAGRAGRPSVTSSGAWSPRRGAHRKPGRGNGAAPPPLTVADLLLRENAPLPVPAWDESAVATRRGIVLSGALLTCAVTVGAGALLGDGPVAILVTGGPGPAVGTVDLAADVVRPTPSTAPGDGPSDTLGAAAPVVAAAEPRPVIGSDTATVGRVTDRGAAQSGPLRSPALDGVAAAITEQETPAPEPAVRAIVLPPTPSPALAEPSAPDVVEGTVLRVAAADPLPPSARPAGRVAAGVADPDVDPGSGPVSGSARSFASDDVEGTAAAASAAGADQVPTGPPSAGRAVPRETEVVPDSSPDVPEPAPSSTGPLLTSAPATSDPPAAGDAAEPEPGAASSPGDPPDDSSTTGSPTAADRDAADATAEVRPAEAEPDAPRARDESEVEQPVVVEPGSEPFEGDEPPGGVGQDTE